MSIYSELAATAQCPACRYNYIHSHKAQRLHWASLLSCRLHSTAAWAAFSHRTRVSDKVRGLCQICLVGSGRARVVEFSYYESCKTMETTRSRHGWVHMFITHRPTVTLQLHNFDLFRTCRTSSFCTVAWQLARFQLTQRIARSLGDSWASCSAKSEIEVVRRRCRTQGGGR